MKYQTKLFAFAAFFFALASGPLLAEQPQIGESEFKNYCAGCHGLDGKGNGPFVEFLKTSPRSLTTLAQENQGVFPFHRIYEVIDGTSQVPAHGARAIPPTGINCAFLMWILSNLSQPTVSALYLLLPSSRRVACCTDDQNRVFSAGFGTTSAVALRACTPEGASAHGGSLVEESGS